MFNHQPCLQSSRLELRPLTAGDWTALYAVAADPLIWKVHPQHDRYQETAFRIFFDEGLASGGALVAVDRASGALIGSSRYSEQYTQPGEIEIGWTFLARSHWGGTYNRQMKQLMLAHAFHDFETVIFRIGEHNSRSRRAVEKLGAVLTDRLQKTLVGEVLMTNVCYALNRQSEAALTLCAGD